MRTVVAPYYPAISKVATGVQEGYYSNVLFIKQEKLESGELNIYIVNDKFKENFYKEKGLDKCWVKDCPNKIYQNENDYKKVKIPCQDKHTRYVCVDCSNKVNLKKTAAEEPHTCEKCGG
ncbi:2739_t:CDS:2 [Entrophospora sp. SA101]|nr:2739_t:CDS:2 [Entrophospora sp. SA101]